MQFSIIAFYLPFYCALASYLVHYSISLYCAFLNWTKRSDEVIGVIWHMYGDVVVNIYKKGVIIRLEFLCYISYSLLLIIWWSINFLKDLDSFTISLVSDPLIFSFFLDLWYLWQYLFFNYHVLVLMCIVVFVRLYPVFDIFPNHHFIPMNLFFRLSIWQYPPSSLTHD